MPIKLLGNSILHEAVVQKATDIHFIPIKKGGIVQFRIDDRLIEHRKLSQEEYIRVLAHFKYSARMDIGEHRKPQSGSMDVLINNVNVHLRFSSIPSAFNESLVIRLLPQQETLALHELSLFPHVFQKLLSLIKRSSGLLLFSGPTGSGKTTILYSLLHHLQKNYKRQVVTLEDPVERKVDSFLQMEINEKAGLTYGEGFKSLLRHDPDVIMIGEIRDESTARLVIRASLTGHLVLSTMHAADCIGCIERLREFGIQETELQQTLMGIVSQRLISIPCPFCGDDCVDFCFKFRTYRRAGIYEMLCNQELLSSLSKVSVDMPTYKNLSFSFNHAFAAGYVTKESYERWMGGETKSDKKGLETGFSRDVSL
ncbi:type II/IV secretion system protein [Fictibacillus sp. 23RED33]|uniref:competence type IV pilus ATPase ComGA n=1 Tax=Fictibacillus sp. 23RED33 TaxID=2745879 RepID=UPI0018CE322D|nr:competence type IV pilus ATPase ComGA [Fictibacillus sp. 23RED33]MBH0174570.1 type II/IV secretion system protein [Fictibacillus sp. 23RED33]